MTESGTSRFPLGSRITYIARQPTPSDAIAQVEIEHHVQRCPGIAAEHIDQRWPLPGSDRSERICEEFPAAQDTSLPVQVAHHMGQALIIKSDERLGVGLPVPGEPVDVIERVPDLMAHHV